MKKRSFLVLLAVSLFCLSRVYGADFLPTQRFTLNNGLTVLVTPMPGSSMVSVYGLVKTGSATEGEYLGAGLSHFMEHMLFKGTDRRNVGDIAGEVQSLGGTINAGTHFDYTIYTITVPAVHLEQAADILSDMLMHPKFDAQEIEKERDVVFNEIRMYYDQPERYLSRQVFQTVYRVHPYRLPIIGFEDLLKPLTREDFLSYYRRHYVPNNMVVSVAGGISSDSALAVVRKFFDSYPMGKYESPNVPAEPRQIAERVYDDYYQTDLVRISLAYAGVDVLSEDMPALDALAMILGEGRGSRLYVSLVDEKEIAHAVSASNFTPKDQGVFEIQVSSAQDHVKDILREIDRQINRIARKGVSKSELKKTVNASLKALFEECQSSSEVAYRTALDEAVTGKYDFTEWYVQKFQALTSEDIRRVARIYLQPERRSVVVLRPEHLRTEDETQTQKNADSSMERIVLDNGLMIVLQEDKTLPLVWMNMVFQAGTHEEPSGLNGLSQLTAALWTKGSKRYPYQRLAALTEQEGISFSGFSGQNSFGLQINSLSRDKKFCLELLSDAVLNPLFSEEIFFSEKARQQTEIARRNDDIRYVGSLALREILFGRHPLGLPSLGTKDSVDGISQRDVLAFHKRYAVPSNAVLSVFGDFEKEDMIALVKKYFSSWKGEKVPLSQPRAEPVLSEKVKTVYADKKQAAVVFGVQAESFYDDHRCGLEVLGAVIGSPFNGRMFRLIREQQGLSYTLGGGYAPARSAGEMVFQILTAPDKADQVQDAFKDIVRDIQQNGVTDTELQDVKAYLIGNAERSWELGGNLSFRVALDELYGIGYSDYQQYAQRIQAVTAAQVQELAQKYLQSDRGVFVVVLPKGSDGSLEEESMAEKAKALE